MKRTMTRVDLPQRHALKLNPGMHVGCRAEAIHAEFQLRAQSASTQQPVNRQRLSQARDLERPSAAGDGGQLRKAFGLRELRVTRRVWTWMLAMPFQPSERAFISEQTQRQRDCRLSDRQHAQLPALT